MLKIYVSTGITFLFTILSICYSPDTQAGPEIIGAPGCKSCHRAKTGDQWKIWTESAHARAFETLASAEARKIAGDRGLADPQREVVCLKCHATRSFLGPDAVVKENGKYADSEGVGCESCHGPGSDYKPKKVMTDPEAARAAGLIMDNTGHGCIQCHNAESPTFKGFDFEKRWAEIAHPVPSTETSETKTPESNDDMPVEITYTSSVGDVRFPHTVHAKELEIECSECHHQIHAKELVTPHPDYLTSSWIRCQACHDTSLASNLASTRTYYKCSHCHLSNPDSIADETLSSKVVVHKSCWKCHESGTGVQASESCVECHVKAKK